MKKRKPKVTKEEAKKGRREKKDDDDDSSSEGDNLPLISLKERPATPGQFHTMITTATYSLETDRFTSHCFFHRSNTWISVGWSFLCSNFHVHRTRCASYRSCLAFGLLSVFRPRLRDIKTALAFSKIFLGCY